jgi:hypothetical protein
VPMASIDAGPLVDLSAMLESIVCSCFGVKTMRCRSEKGDCAHFSWNGGVASSGSMDECSYSAGHSLDTCHGNQLPYLVRGPYQNLLHPI